MSEQKPTIKEEIAAAIEEGQAIPKVVKLPITKEKHTVSDLDLDSNDTMYNIIPIERYNHRDIKRALRADKKRAAKLEEYKLVRDCKTDHQKTVFCRMKASEERKLLMGYIFLVVITYVGGYAALGEAIRAVFGG